MADIEVVLTETDPKLGTRGQVIKVSSGFANNFLIPHKKALLATAANLKSFQAEKARLSLKESQAKADAEELAKKILATSLTIEVLTGEGEKLYGAVNSQDVQQALLAQGISLERKDIHLAEPIHKLGAYQIDVKLHPHVTAQLKLWVVKKKS